MKDNQENIYYLCGEDINVMKKSKLFTRFKKQGFNVILMDETIDEYLVQQLRTFSHEDKNYTLQSINREGLVIPGEEIFEEDSELVEFCTAIKSHCGVEKVVQTDKIEDPFSILSTAYGWSSNMQRIMKSQALSSNDIMTSKKILEINVRHPLIIRLQKQFYETKSFDAVNKNMLSLLFETASISAGYDLIDPSSYCSKIYKVFESLDITDVEETQVEETQVEETQVDETQVDETQVEETQVDETDMEQVD
jgi:molecular chaperone HtpG